MFMENTKIILIVFAIVATLCNSCFRINDVEIDKNINDEPFLKSVNYYNLKHLANWKLDASFVEDSVSIHNINGLYYGGYYYYMKRVEDTIYNLSIEYYDSNNDTLFIPKECYMRYETDYFQHVILFGENSDTLFHYKASLFGALNKVFISGKYYYQYLFFGLNKKQLDFFLLHEDSLTSIKGQNLPLLPELDSLR